VQEVLDVPNEVAVELAGIGDGVLSALRERLGCAINLRGNRLTLEGEDAIVV
jgi:phosphate starvation-inducible protein PhoH